MALGMCLVCGPRGGCFLISEVPLYSSFIERRVTGEFHEIGQSTASRLLLTSLGDCPPPQHGLANRAIYRNVPEDEAKQDVGVP